MGKRWRGKAILDDGLVPGYSNRRGTLSFATGGPNTRETQMFFNIQDNRNLDEDRANGVPFGEIVQGVEESVQWRNITTTLDTAASDLLVTSSYDHCHGSCMM